MPVKTSLEVWFGQTLKEEKLWFRFCAYIPSQLFKLGIKVRHFLYDHGVKKETKVPIPVISIGNLVAGGTGKTQITQFLAKELSKIYRVAILSRGYRSHAENGSKPFLVDATLHSPEECGDEPWLLASGLPKAMVLSGKHRVKSAALAVKKGIEVLLLDDGMQHRKLHRDVEIVTLYGNDPLGHHAYLPRGMLRDDPKRLSKADLILICGKCLPQDKELICKLSEAPIVSFISKPLGIFSLGGKPVDYKGKRVSVFCGIGYPERFVKSVESMGMEVVSNYFLPDHAPVERFELNKYCSDAKKNGAELLLCTEKDKIKLPRSFESSLPIGWVQSEIDICENQTAWMEMVDGINQLIRKKT